MAPSYLVNEIYPCLQGEGVNLGKPSLLIRFQICNLRCSWCDTPYTHTIKSDPKDSSSPNGLQKFQRHSLDKLIAIIQSFNMKHLIFSGGEPTLQNIAHIMKKLGDEFTAEVETNGTRIPHLQIPNFSEDDYKKFQWNVSPKFANANENIIPESIEHWANLSKIHPFVYFKFVVREKYSTDDMQNIFEIIQSFKINSDRVILMPEGTTVESQISNSWLHDICLNNNFRYSPRLHVLLFGNERGV